MIKAFPTFLKFLLSIHLKFSNEIIIIAISYIQFAFLYIIVVKCQEFF